MAEEVLAIWDIAPVTTAEEQNRKGGKEGEIQSGGWAASPIMPGGPKTAKICTLKAENKADMQKTIRELFGARTTVFYVKKAGVEE